jgi:beta-1,4-mannosyltransferase
MIGNSKLITIIKSIDFICELVLLKLSGVKIIWTVHNIADHGGKFRSLELSFNKFLAALCDRLIVHCTPAKSEVMKVYCKSASSIGVISHGNYIGMYKNVITSSEARNQLKLDPQDTVFLHFGLIRPYKGVTELISAFKKLNHPQAKLLIAGKPHDDKIAAQIIDSCKNDENIINILEFIPDENIQLYMNAADVIVFPFKDILTSGSVILAMSFGKPVIAPQAGCISDILNEKGSFLYLRIENGLLEAMQCALTAGKKNLLDMGLYNFELARQLGWDEIAKRTYDIYQECLNKN